MNTDIKTYDMQGLQQAMKELGQPAFRAKQIYEWLWYTHVDSFDKMTNLSLALREELASRFSLSTPKLVDKQESTDGTRKYVLELSDGALVETVGIPADASRERLTVCFSTQVGCPMECVFCATGHEGFTRNLTIGEIVDQVYFVEEDFGRRVSNVVHVNILPMNDIEGSYFVATPQKTVKHWLDSLEKHHIEATLRSSRGSDIAGACGQLKNKQISQ